MMQLTLFPPQGALAKPLPDEVLVATRSLLAELLAVVVEKETQEEPKAEGGADE
jgi:hypothetical protein